MIRRHVMIGGDAAVAGSAGATYLKLRTTGAIAAYCSTAAVTRAALQQLAVRRDFVPTSTASRRSELALRFGDGPGLPYSVRRSASEVLV
jgi:hypothetical protein